MNQHFARFGVDGMRNVLIVTLVGFTVGHGDKRTVGTVDNLDVVDNKAIVNSDGCDRFQFAVFFFYDANTYVSNVHFSTPIVGYACILQQDSENFNIFFNFLVKNRKIFFMQDKTGVKTLPISVCGNNFL